MQTCDYLIRGGLIVIDPELGEAGILRHGGLAIRADRIVAVDDWKTLQSSFNAIETFGSDDHWVLPGFINAHDHGRGITTKSVGIEDDGLEAWIIDLIRYPEISIRDSTTLAALLQLESGISTTVNSFFVNSPGAYVSTLKEIVKGYQDTGIRAGIVMSMLDQSVVDDVLNRLIPILPDSLRVFVIDLLNARNKLSSEEYFTALNKAHEYTSNSLVWPMAGPVSVHWCSDPLLTAIWQAAEKLNLTLQTHLLESQYQAQAAAKIYGQSTLLHMDKLGLLTENLSAVHCVYTDSSDHRLMATKKVSAVISPSSNLRLKNDLAPLGSMLNAGMNVALGLDSQSLDDNVDMFAEMRLLITLLETKGTQLPFHQILCMATTGAAKALSIDTKVGNLNAEMQADVLLIDANKFTYISENPYQDIIQHGAPEKIDFLMIAGQLIIDDGKHFKLERAVLEKSLQQELDTIQDTTTDKALALKPFINALINESSP